MCNNPKSVHAALSVFLLCLFASTASYADKKAKDQLSESISKELKENTEGILEQDAAFFQDVRVPDNWKDKSAIVLGSSIEFRYDRVSGLLARSMNISEVTHKLILLKDKDAVSSFSTVYFRAYLPLESAYRYSNHTRDGFSVTVLKKDGQVKEVPLKGAIAVTNIEEVPSEFRPYLSELYMRDLRVSKYNPNEAARYPVYKIAVPNLEEGDVIEYVSRVAFSSFDKEEMPAVYFFMRQHYPVVKQRMDLITDEKVYVSCMALNGNPVYKEISRKDLVHHVWEVGNTDAFKLNDWMNPYKELEHVKFQVALSSPQKYDFTLTGSKGEARSAITPSELAQRVANALEAVHKERQRIQIFSVSNVLSELMFAASLTGELKKVPYDKSDLAKYLEGLFYTTRHEYIKRDEMLRDAYFAEVLIRRLEDNDIPYEIIIGVTNRIGSLGNVLFKSELEWIIKVGDYYIYNPTTYSVFNDLPHYMADATAYRIDMKNGAEAVPVKLPVLSTSRNYERNEMLVAIDAADNSFSVAQTTSASGAVRQQVSSYVLEYTLAMLDDYLCSNSEAPDQEMSKKEKENFKRLVATREEEFKRLKKDQMKEVLSKEYDEVMEADSFRLIADGRCGEGEIKYTLNFKTGDMVQNAGSNLIVSIPALIGKHPQIKDEDTAMGKEIYLKYPRKLSYHIEVKIPDGYTPVNQNDLVRTFDNTIGAFQVTVTTAEGKLIMDVSKEYKQATASSSDWELLKTFVNSVYDFSQSKLLLRKVS